MKKLFMAVLLVTAFSISVYAQKQPAEPAVQVPIDSITKLITYEGVVPVGNLKAGALYKRALSWFNTFYKNPSEVIRENDSLKFKIAGKPRFRLTNPPDKTGLKTEGGLVQYTITVAARDGRFKYEITEFNSKQISYTPCEKWLDTKSAGYLPVYNEYLKQLDDYTNDLISNLKNALMNEKPVKDKDKW